MLRPRLHTLDNQVCWSENCCWLHMLITALQHTLMTRSIEDEDRKREVCDQAGLSTQFSTILNILCCVTPKLEDSLQCMLPGRLALELNLTKVLQTACCSWCHQGAIFLEAVRKSAQKQSYLVHGQKAHILSNVCNVGLWREAEGCISSTG